ncbi:unnamed protein product [Mycena citricolor]|uniref:Uncharacterized protein n=1 Tax=Mycena citricolor TaxID=2018698 RepID=A0AAD2H3B5_9AGAR|nr:unnamed protein product [Mycena citricolor]
MARTISAAFVLSAFLVGGINAANDWTVPCVSGSCNYDIPTGQNSTNASGTMKIWGSANAITDITTAAGWEILSCNSTAQAQNITLVCTQGQDQDPNSLCSHLYQNNGAVHKIVRLPENCHASPFARVALAWVPQDQTIPAHVRRMMKRGSTPVVKALRIDTAFDQVDYSKTGAVNIALQGANVPGAPTTLLMPTNSRRSLRRRGFGSIIHSIKNGVDNAAGAVKNAADGAANAVKNEATKAAGDVKSVATAVAGAAKTAASDAAAAAKSIANNTVSVNKNINLPPINFQQSKQLISQSVACGPISATLDANFDGNANAQASLSVAAQGTIVPPKISSFGAILGMNGNIQGTLQLNSDVSGALDSGKITLVDIGIPGLDIPGIFSAGPTFQVAAQLSGSLDVAMDATVGVNLNMNNAQIALPPSNSDFASAFSFGDTPLTLNADPNVAVTGSITAHLIPSINLGVSALGNAASAKIFLELDANAGVTLNLDASTSVTAAKNLTPGSANNAASNSTATATDSTAAADASATDATSTDTATDSTATDATSTDTATDSAATDATATDASAASTATDATVTDSAVDSSATDATASATDSATDSTATDATAVDNSAASTDTAVGSTATDATSTDTATDSTATDATSTDTAVDTSATDATSTDTATDSTATDATSTDTATDSTATDATSTDTATDSTATDASAVDNSATSTDAAAASAVTNGVSVAPVSFGGCVGAAGNININVGATGSFFNLFNAFSKTKTLFNKDFQIFQKCFGDQAAGAAGATATDAAAAADATATDAAAAAADPAATDASSTDTAAAAASTDAPAAKRSSERRYIFNGSSLVRRALKLSCPANIGTSSKAKKQTITSSKIPASSIKALAAPAPAPAAPKAAAPAKAAKTANVNTKVAAAKTAAAAKSAAAKTTAAKKAAATK